MMVVREPVTPEMMAAEVMAAAATMEGWSRSEAAAAKMHTAAVMAAPAKMHATAAVTASAKVAATVTAAAMAAAHLRGQAFRDLLGHIRLTRIDQ